MDSWSRPGRTGLRFTRCPVHGGLVVAQRDRTLVSRCYDCLDDAARALRRLKVEG